MVVKTRRNGVGWGYLDTRHIYIKKTDGPLYHTIRL